MPNAQQFRQLITSPVKTGRLDAVDLLMQTERLGRRQIPPKLVLLAHYQGESPPIGVLSPPWDVPHDPGSA